MPFGLLVQVTLHVPLPLNASAPSLVSKLLPVLYDENYANLDTDGILHAPGPLSLVHKQRRDSPLHEYTGGGVHQIIQLHERGEGTGGRLSSQMSILGRQERRDGLGLHDERTKRGILLVYGRYISQEGLQL
jgi:hypothetical protein